MELHEEPTSLDLSKFAVDFIFRHRPTAIPADLRPGWRIGLLVLLLKNCCREFRSSFARIHVLSWGSRTIANREQLSQAAKGDFAPDAIVVRFEPFLNQALDYAIGEGLVRRENGNRIELTEQGLALAKEIEGVPELFVEEKAFISDIKMKVTEKLVDGMFGGRAAK